MSTYEELLVEVQSELVAASLEYAGSGVSDVYIFGSTEQNTIFFDPFFAVDGRIYERHKVPAVDTSIPRQRALVKYGNKQLRRLVEASTEFNQPLPLRLKLHYEVAKRSLDSAFEYVPLVSATVGLTEQDISDQWRASLEAELTD